MATRSRGTALRWIREHPYAFMGILVFVALLIPFCRRAHTEWEEVYVRTAAHLLAGRDIYRQTDGYLYPPFTAWLAIPWTFQPRLLGRLTWYGINVFCMVSMFRAAWRISGGGSLQGAAANDPREHLICLLGGACGLWYSFHAMAHQQTDLLIGALVLAGCLALHRQRGVRGAIFFGLAAAMKCTALLWIPYLVLRKQWRAACCLAAVAVGANLLPDLVHRAPEGGTWLGQWSTTYLQPMGKKDHVPGVWGSAIIYNQSLPGAVNRWFLTRLAWSGNELTVAEHPGTASPLQLKVLLYSSEGLLLLAAAYACAGGLAYRSGAESEGPSRQALESAMVVSFMVLLSPMSSIPHFCTLVFPGFCVARLAVRQRSRGLWALVVLAILTAALSNKDLWGESIYTAALWCGDMTWNTLFLLVGCGLALRQRRPQRIAEPWATERAAA